LEAAPSSVSQDGINEEVKQGGDSSFYWEEDDKKLKEDKFQLALESLIVKYECNYKSTNTFNLKSKVQIAKLGSVLKSSIV
jgi:hypothetical protein